MLLRKLCKPEDNEHHKSAERKKKKKTSRILIPEDQNFKTMKMNVKQKL